MIEQEPLALVLHDTMMGRPAYDRVEDDTLIGEGTIGIVADGIAEEVTVARRVAEVILSIVLMHPGGLEETVGIACLQGRTVFVKDHHRTGSLGKLLHIVAQTKLESAGTSAGA